MTKWMYLAMWFSIALVLGVSIPAAAQSQDQKSDSQQQSSQQQSSQQQKKQSNAKQSDMKQSDKKQAAGGSETASGQNQKASGQQGMFITAQKSSQVLASSVMGMTIQNGQGKKAKEIGTVNDLIMNKQHQLVGVVVGIGGFLGIGQKSVGVKWDAVQNINAEKGIAVVSVSKKQLQNAPSFVTKHEQKQKKKQEQAKEKMKKQQQKKKAQQKQKMQQQQQQQMPSSQSGDASSSGG